MKIALCFFGCAPMDTLRNSAKGQIHHDVTKKHWLKNVIEPNNPDVFIHCWSPQYEQEYTDTYHPKKWLFEPTRKFPTKRRQKIMDYNMTNDEIMTSVHYSLKQSIDMKTKYEEENNFKYDLVMIARMDIIWFNKLSLSKFDPNFINVSPWNYVDISKTRLMKDIILDYFIITSSELANKISDLYLEIEKYCTYCAPMVAKSHYLKDKKLLHKIKTDHVKRFHDFILFRHLYNNYKRKNEGDEWTGMHEHKKILLDKIIE